MMNKRQRKKAWNKVMLELAVDAYRSYYGYKMDWMMFETHEEDV